MTPAQHREQIVTRLADRFRAKYDKGQVEHGGRLWEKPDMLAHAIDEVLDLVSYLFTLEDQLKPKDESLPRP